LENEQFARVDDECCGVVLHLSRANGCRAHPVLSAETRVKNDKRICLVSRFFHGKFDACGHSFYGKQAGVCRADKNDADIRVFFAVQPHHRGKNDPRCTVCADSRTFPFAIELFRGAPDRKAEGSKRSEELPNIAFC
jgi:hypothetical protein